MQEMGNRIGCAVSYAHLLREPSRCVDLIEFQEMGWLQV